MQNLLFKIGLIFAGMGYNMRRMIILVAIILGIITSCKELYDPKIDTVGTRLVVDGLITDEAKSYSIKLTKALPFNNNGDMNVYTSVSKAKVTVSDDCGYTYHFIEIDSGGVYMSDPAEFIGVPGRSYTLSIKTIDNKEYRSAPQLLLPNNFNVTVSADFGSRDQLVEDGSGTFIKTTMDGVNILYDIENIDTLTRFRFGHKTYKQYVETGKTTIRCWGLMPDYDLVNITDNYNTSTKNIEKHNVCFIPNAKNGSIIIEGTDYVVIVSKFITKIIQYRLNDESYQFYKNVNTLITATNKIFDPITLQVKGNIKCISDNNDEVLGFFEASSAVVSYYALNPGSKELQFIKSYEPPHDFGCPTTPPDFWVW
jgi:hypothetical protein